MTEVTVVQALADPNQLAASKQNADAQTQIAESGVRYAEAVTKLASWDEDPRPDHSVWLDVFLQRCGMANNTYAALEKAAAYADKALALYKTKYPREAEPVMPVSTGPAVA